jgi:hypothetical protein
MTGELRCDDRDFTKGEQHEYFKINAAAWQKPGG